MDEDEYMEEDSETDVFEAFSKEDLAMPTTIEDATVIRKLDLSDTTLYNRYHVLLYRVLVAIMSSEKKKMNTRELAEALGKTPRELTFVMHKYKKYKYLRRSSSRVIDEVTNRKAYTYKVTDYGKTTYMVLHRRILNGLDLKQTKDHIPESIDRYVNAFLGDKADPEFVKAVTEIVNEKFRDLFVNDFNGSQ
jgi:hypothetical protein